MKISVATATYYMLPFEQTLEIIAQAGFQNIELDLYWQRKNWAMAQHLHGALPEQVIAQVRQAGLTIASIHDGGGVLESPDSVEGYINPDLRKYLDAMDMPPECLVFHTPHIEGNLDQYWWQAISGRIVDILAPFRAVCPAVTIENMPYLDGYYVPLISPEDLLAFTRQAGVGVNLDTTHYAYMEINILNVAKTLAGSIETIHLSDYRNGRMHVFVGDGDLDLPAFFDALDLASLRCITLECDPVYWGENLVEMDTQALVDRLKTAKTRVEQWIESRSGRSESVQKFTVW